MQQAMQLYPDLVLPAVRVAMAMPPTQVSVERLFSVLKLTSIFQLPVGFFCARVHY